jgi:hypothetical protein
MCGPLFMIVVSRWEVNGFPCSDFVYFSRSIQNGNTAVLLIGIIFGENLAI